jgi:ABC-type sugar transport system permease subunit
MEQKKKKITAETVKKYVFVYSFLIVQIICFFVFYLAINLNSILLAFKVPTGEQWYYNFEYFLKVSTTTVPLFSEYLPNTLKFFLTEWLLLLIGFMFSYYIYKKITGYRFFRVMFFLPSIISSAVLVMLYKKMVGIGGPIVELYKLFCGSTKGIELLANSDTATVMIVIYMLWVGFGGKILILGGAMSRLPEDVIEYGKLEGIKPLREMFTIVLPMIWPTISTLITLIMTGIFTASGPILLFTKGAYHTTTISYYIWTQVYGAPIGRYPVASAIGLFFTAIGLPIVLLVKHVCAKLDAEVSY